MSTLIILVLFAIVVSYMAIQNTVMVTMSLVGYSFSTHLYLIILGSLLVGFIIAGVISSINSMFSAFKIMGKNKTINTSQKEIDELKEKIHHLEIENAELKVTKTPVIIKKEN